MFQLKDDTRCFYFFGNIHKYYIWLKMYYISFLSFLFYIYLCLYISLPRACCPLLYIHSHNKNVHPRLAAPQPAARFLWSFCGHTEWRLSSWRRLGRDSGRLLGTPEVLIFKHSSKRPRLRCRHLLCCFPQVCPRATCPKVGRQMSAGHNNINITALRYQLVAVGFNWTIILEQFNNNKW